LVGLAPGLVAVARTTIGMPSGTGARAMLLMPRQAQVS
jgi:hypothetical protein